MGLENFNPSIWSAKLFVRLRKNLVFGGVVNTDYEGEITEYGSSVRINEISPVTVNTYTKYSSLTWQELDSAQKMLLIDQADSFSFTIDDIDAAQQRPKLMGGAMDEAAYAIADSVDQYIAGKYTDAGVTNATYLGESDSGLSTSSGNVIERFSYVMRYMNEANVPTSGRIAIIKPWVHQKLLLAEVGGISATAVPKVFDDGMIASGFIGQALGFQIFVSNNVQSTSTVDHNMFLTRQAISYAGQISRIEAIRREDYFDEGMKGLYLYGAKVVRPNALAVGHWTEAAG